MYDKVRYYDGNYNPYLARRYLEVKAGSMFNKDIVNIFLEYAPCYSVGSIVTLSTGEKVVVYAQNHSLEDPNKIIAPDKPQVIILDGKRKGLKLNLIGCVEIIVSSENNNIMKTKRK